jgi:hypothetical protein
MKPFVTDARGCSVLHSCGLIADDCLLLRNHICESTAWCRVGRIVHNESKNILQVYVQFFPISAISAQNAKEVRLLEKRVSAKGVLRDGVRSLETQA